MSKKELPVCKKNGNLLATIKERIKALTMDCSTITNLSK